MVTTSQDHPVPHSVLAKRTEGAARVVMRHPSLDLEEGGEGRLLRASEGAMSWCMHIGKGYRTLYVGRWNIHMLRPFQRGDTSNGVLMIEWNGMSQR